VSATCKRTGIDTAGAGWLSRLKAATYSEQYYDSLPLLQISGGMLSVPNPTEACGKVSKRPGCGAGWQRFRPRCI